MNGTTSEPAARAGAGRLLPSVRAGALRLLPSGRADRLLFALALAFAALVRLPGVASAFWFGDELHSLSELSRGYGALISHFGETGSGLLLPLLQRLLLDVFGSGHFSLRAPAWLAGLALVPSVFVVARRSVGERVALAASWLVAALPLLVFYSHFARAYALVVLLAWWLLGVVTAVVADGRLPRRRFAALVLLIAATPFAHPTALASVVPIVAAGVFALLGARPHTAEVRRRAALALTAALALGGVACAALHAAAYASLLAFVSEKTAQSFAGAFGPLDVAALATGSREAALALAVLALFGTGAQLRRTGFAALPLVAAAAAPLLVIAALRPYGDAYAYARYAIAALPPVALLAAIGVDRALALGPRAIAQGSPWLVAALAAALLLTGPGRPFAKPAPEHANTYLELFALPAFDAPWAETPAFYRALAGWRARGEPRPTVIEAPALTTRTRHLYRNYGLQHGARTLLAPLAGEFPFVPQGPYLALFQPGRVERSGADYLVVHRDIERELAAYWRSVYARERANEDERVAAFMARHAQYPGPLPAPTPMQLAALAARFGEPVYSDDRLVVYRIDGPDEPAEPAPAP